MIVYWPWFFIFFAYGISLVLRNSMVIEIKIAYTTSDSERHLWIIMMHILGEFQILSQKIYFISMTTSW